MDMFVGILSRYPLLALVVPRPLLHSVRNILNLKQHSLQVFLAPQLLSPDLLLAHQHTRDPLLHLALLNCRFLQLPR